jgi:hypothetical protein
MCGNTTKDRIRDGVKCEKVGVALVEDKMWESHLRWFEHVQERLVDASM